MQQENQHQCSEHQPPCVEHFDKHRLVLLLQHHEPKARYPQQEEQTLKK